MKTNNPKLSQFKANAESLRQMVLLNPTPTKSQMLQMVSQSFYHKPYEEIKETVFGEKRKVEKEKNVFYFFCGKMAYLFIDSNFFEAFNISNYKPISKIRSLLALNNIEYSTIQGTCLPVTSNNLTPDNIKALAEKLGLFSTDSLFYHFEKEFFLTYQQPHVRNQNLLVDNQFFNEDLVGDWIDVYENEEDGEDALILIIENNNGLELCISVRDFITAKRIDLTTWKMKVGQDDAYFSFFRK